MIDNVFSALTEGPPLQQGVDNLAFVFLILLPPDLSLIDHDGRLVFESSHGYASMIALHLWKAP